MANNKSAKKRVRQAAKTRLANRYDGKTTRNAIRKLEGAETKSEATQDLPKVTSLIDKLAKKNIIHKKKAANLKSRLTKMVNGLS